MVNLSNADLLKLTRYSMETALFYNDKITNKTLSQRPVVFVKPNREFFLIQLGVEVSQKEINKLTQKIESLQSEKAYKLLEGNLLNFDIMGLVNDEQANKMRQIARGNFNIEMKADEATC